MPGGVRQGLLDDAVSGPVHGRREGTLLSGHPQIDGEPRGAGLLDQQRRCTGRLVGPQHLQCGAQFTHRLTAGLLDGEQCGRHLLAPLARQMDGDSRLELDDRDAVGQRVVQLPCDAQSFLTGTAQCRFLAGPFGLQGALFGLAQIGPPVAVGEACDQGAQEPAG